MADDTLSSLNPLFGIYSEFEKIISNIIIKYNYLAEADETYEGKRNADQYLAALEGKDTFFTYRDYTYEEFLQVGINDASLIAKYSVGNGYMDIPQRYREPLLLIRRNNIIQNYDEQNNYYRMLNGLPPRGTKPNQFHYVPDYYAKKYGMSTSVPIHQIQDYYNNIEETQGDYFISILEGLGIIKELIKHYPDEEYLKHIGSNRVSIADARRAKNFQILRIHQSSVKDSLYISFLGTYEQCRDYFMTVVYIREYRNFIDYYDHFIAMCIMLMTLQTVINKQFSLGIRREFFNDYTLKLLYEAYGIPYDLKIDQITQKRIAQNLNLLIQNKATDKVLYDIASILGFGKLNIYKYYLAKVHKEDIYGVPIIKWTTEFNSDTGQYDTVPDYKAMYDIYFQKVDIKEDDFVQSFNNNSNKVKYKKVVTDDPFWWEDSNLASQLWETEYSFVESKYLGLSVSYKMSDIMYENIMLLRMLMDEKSDLGSIRFTLPRIDSDLKITFFDAVILLCCLTCKKHHLTGEIISIPTQVISVLDYMHNTDGDDEYVADSFGFNLKYLLPENTEGQELVSLLKKLLGKEDKNAPEVLAKYLSVLSIDKDLPNAQKINLINEMYQNAKGLSKYIQYKMAETHNRQTYEALKKFYRAMFYSKETKELFTINNGDEVNRRTAFNYFEFLYHYNPKLYSIIFVTNFEAQYAAYLKEHELSTSEYTQDDYQSDIDYGRVPFDYSTLNKENTDMTISDDLIYFYVIHIISRLEEYIKDINFLYMITDSATPLEMLLLRLIRFFKSFTVDIVGLDTIYVTDLRAENIMRFFDEVARIKKTIQIRENMYVSYSDVLHLIIAHFKFDEKTIKLIDKEMHNATLYVTKDRNGKSYNLINFNDVIDCIDKVIHIGSNDQEKIGFVDIARIQSSRVVDDRATDRQPRFRDTVRIFYSD